MRIYFCLVCLALLPPLSAQAGDTSASSPDQALYLAAGTVQGVSTLGAAPPIAPSPPGSYSSNPQDFHRGYVGNSPNDPWMRDNDFKARDYQFRHSPQPEYAVPPPSPEQTSPGYGDWVYRPPNLAGPRMPESLGKRTMPYIPAPAGTQKRGKEPTAAKDGKPSASEGPNSGKDSGTDSLRRIIPN